MQTLVESPLSGLPAGAAGPIPADSILYGVVEEAGRLVGRRFTAAQLRGNPWPALDPRDFGGFFDGQYHPESSG